MLFRNESGGREAVELSFCVSGSGETLAQPQELGNYSAALRATDAAGDTTDVHVWEFAVVEPPEEKVFATKLGWDALKEGKNIKKYNTQASHVQGSTTTTTAMAGTENIFINCKDDDCGQVTYRLEFDGGRTPGQWLIDSGTGATLGTPTTISASYTARLVAFDGQSSVTVL